MNSNQTDILNLYQKYCLYTINHGIQKLDIAVDFDRLYKEVTTFISNNKFGFNSISLKLPNPSNNNQDYLNFSDDVRYSALYEIKDSAHQKNPYVFWHPQLEQSYIKELSTVIENYSGFTVGNVRLVWIYPNEHYAMHVDLEPLRFHIPIITNKYCYFIEDNKLYHMDQKNVYHILTTSVHTASNYGKLPRLHLIYSTDFPADIYDQIKQNFTGQSLQDLLYSHLDDVDLQFISLTSMLDKDSKLSFDLKGLLQDLAKVRKANS